MAVSGWWWRRWRPFWWRWWAFRRRRRAFQRRRRTASVVRMFAASAALASGRHAVVRSHQWRACSRLSFQRHTFSRSYAWRLAFSRSRRVSGSSLRWPVGPLGTIGAIILNHWRAIGLARRMGQMGRIDLLALLLRRPFRLHALALRLLRSVLGLWRYFRLGCHVLARSRLRLWPSVYDVYGELRIWRPCTNTRRQSPQCRPRNHRLHNPIHNDLAQTCGGLAPGVTDLPFDYIEQAITADRRTAQSTRRAKSGFVTGERCSQSILFERSPAYAAG